ncbi:MAG: 6-phosphogluconolactonase [Bacteroidetes bacterium]|nr:MAG: 6-phosphogluconolactonase [Bacteroidota bacterium]
MATSIKVCKNTDELSQFFAQYIISRINACAEGDFFSIALSGGSTPMAIFQYLTANYRVSIPWHRLLVFWSDERCVAPDDQESNYRMTKENLLNQVPIALENIFRIKGENDPAEEAEEYASIVKQFVPSTNDIPQFDLIMLGLGEDGHTASIFPESLQLFYSEKLFVVAEHPLTRQQRITATGTLINNSKAVVFIVTGKSKSKIVRLVIDQESENRHLPASLVNPEKGELLWLLDEEAAGIII